MGLVKLLWYMYKPDVMSVQTDVDTLKQKHYDCNFIPVHLVYIHTYP